MEGLFLGGSLLAAFLGGAIALFAPCCILVVFPAYLAAAVRNQRWRLVPLTLVFAAGLAVVLVPITLGVGLLTRSLLRYHGPIYVVGGVLLLALAAVSLSGRTWSLPFLRGAPDISRTDSGGVFALGVFSGAASACCAPVLAGVLTLTAVVPSTVQAVGIGLAYVFGMVAPLLVLTLLWDRSALRERLTGTRRVRFRVAGRAVHATVPELAAAAMFAAMGVLAIVLGITGATIAPTFQAGIGTWLEDRLTPVVAWLEPVPDWVTGAVLVALGAGALLLSARARPVAATDPAADIDLDEPGPEDAHEHACHPTA